MNLTLKSGLNQIRLINQEHHIMLSSPGFNQIRLVNKENTVVLRATGALVTNQATGATYSALYDEVYPVKFYIVPASQALNEISIKIIKSFDGIGASLILGDEDILDRFFSISDLDLTTEDVTYQKDFDDAGEIPLVLTIDPGTSASQGEVLIQINTTKKGV